MNNIGLTYLTSRNVDSNDITQFGLSYCDKNLITTPHDYSTTITNQDKYKDSIIIPVYDIYGLFLGIFSRKVTVLPNHSKINGSSWKKTNHLYNMDKAWEHIAKHNFVFVVEGPFDAIALYKYGYKNVVALMQSQISETQAQLLHRYCDRCVLLLDNDAAGKNGALKCKSTLKENDIESIIYKLESDPDVEMVKDSKILQGFYSEELWQKSDGEYCTQKMRTLLMG